MAASVRDREEGRSSEELGREEGQRAWPAAAAASARANGSGRRPREWGKRLLGLRGSRFVTRFGLRMSNGGDGRRGDFEAQ